MERGAGFNSGFVQRFNCLLEVSDGFAFGLDESHCPFVGVVVFNVHLRLGVSIHSVPTKEAILKVFFFPRELGEYPLVEVEWVVLGEEACQGS